MRGIKQKLLSWKEFIILLIGFTGIFIDKYTEPLPGEKRLDKMEYTIRIMVDKVMKLEYHEHDKDI